MPTYLLEVTQFQSEDRSLLPPLLLYQELCNYLSSSQDLHGFEVTVTMSDLLMGGDILYPYPQGCDTYIHQSDRTDPASRTEYHMHWYSNVCSEAWRVRAKVQLHCPPASTRIQSRVLPEVTLVMVGATQTVT